MSTKSNSVTVGDNESFRQTLAAKIGELKTRETLSLKLQALIYLHEDRRQAYAWLKQRQCYVKYVHKRRVVEVQKM